MHYSYLANLENGDLIKMQIAIANRLRADNVPVEEIQKAAELLSAIKAESLNRMFAPQPPKGPYAVSGSPSDLYEQLGGVDAGA